MSAPAADRPTYPTSERMQSVLERGCYCTTEPLENRRVTCHRCCRTNVKRYLILDGDNMCIRCVADLDRLVAPQEQSPAARSVQDMKNLPDATSPDAKLASEFRQRAIQRVVTYGVYHNAQETASRRVQDHPSCLGCSSTAFLRSLVYAENDVCLSCVAGVDQQSVFAHVTVSGQTDSSMKAVTLMATSATRSRCY